MGCKTLQSFDGSKEMDHLIKALLYATDLVKSGKLTRDIAHAHLCELTSDYIRDFRAGARMSDHNVRKVNVAITEAGFPAIAAHYATREERGLHVC